jgi:hypothetical protein
MSERDFDTVHGRTWISPHGRKGGAKQAAEKSVRRHVAASLPRHMLFVFSVRWRRKAAATPFFRSLFSPAPKLTSVVRNPA